MEVVKFLDESGVKYELTQHEPAFTAQRMAAATGEPGRYVAKPVIVRVDGKNMMCVLPASRKIDMDALKSKLGAKSVELLGEKDIGQIFGDCELGAEPPFGNLYDLPTIMDKSLEKDEHIMFQGGTHDKAIRISMADYRRLVSPKVLEFSYQAGS